MTAARFLRVRLLHAGKAASAAATAAATSAAPDAAQEPQTVLLAGLMTSMYLWREEARNSNQQPFVIARAARNVVRSALGYCIKSTWWRSAI